MDKVLIVDGHNLLFRMFCGIPGNIKNRRGEEIKGLIGFIGSLIKLIGEFEPSKVVVVFDSETGSSDRRLMDENYKANRPLFSAEDSDEVNPFFQLPKIKKALEFMEIGYIEHGEAEADDVIATISSKYCKYDFIVIVSTDKDFLQLVDERVKVFSPRGKASIHYDEEKVYEKFLIYPKQFLDYKVLAGDPSDNIKGINGIGKKTAALILSDGDIEAFMELNPDSKHLKKINMDEVVALRNIIRLNCDLKLDFNAQAFILNSREFKTLDIIRAIGEK